MPNEITNVPVNGIRMSYRIDGPEGAPWLTMITGLTNDISMWDPQMPALDKKLRVLRYDLRGQGKTEATPGPYTPELLIADLIALWDHLGIKKSHVMGLGLGGSLVQGIAFRDSCARAASRRSWSRPRSAGSRTISRRRTRSSWIACAP